MLIKTAEYCVLRALRKFYRPRVVREWLLMIPLPKRHISNQTPLDQGSPAFTVEADGPAHQNKNKPQELPLFRAERCLPLLRRVFC